MDGLVGCVLGRYRIAALLGAGGMGAVYKARDTELNRDVAIKVLPEAASNDPQRVERFNREIHTVARLSHPNIVEIFDFGEIDGIHFAVMELLDGRTLRQRMRGRPLPLRTALDIGGAVAAGLGAAHRGGVLHRDMKPENIFVTTKGRVKVLDFGLARTVTDVEPEADTESIAESLTSPGTLLGTTGYQSPEHVRGRELDSRSDIFSFGCVLYEMLSGIHPFRRETRADTLSAILSEEPTPITEYVPDLPPALDLIVSRCLRKNPDHRFESARDVAFALQALTESSSGTRPGFEPPLSIPRRVVRWAAAALAACLVVAAGLAGVRHLSTPVLPDDKHIAVVGFEARRDGDVQVLANGLAAMTADALQPVAEQTRGAVWLAPRTVTMAVEDDAVDAARRTYGVNLIITGRLEMTGSRLSLHLSLVDARTGDTLRESTIDDDLDNLASFQQRPVRVLAAMLGIELTPETSERLRGRTTNHAAALDSFLRGIGRMIPALDEADADSVEALLTEAVEADPLFAAAREALVSLYLERHRATGERSWLDKGLLAADELMQRSPTEPAFLLQARLHQELGDEEAAARVLAGAAQRYRRSAQVQIALGRACQEAGRPDDAERAYERAISRMPGYWLPHYWMGMLDYRRGRYDAAANAWRAVIRCAPEYHGGYTNLGLAYYMLDRRADARDVFERSVELTGGTDYTVLSNLGTLYFDESRFAEAADMFQRALDIFDQRHTLWGNLGQAYAATQDPERAEAPFREAVRLAEAELADSPDDVALLAALAGYHAMLGESDATVRYLDSAIGLGPSDPEQMAVIGEAFEDIGLRDRALDWIGRAIRGGVPPSRFENRPSLRGLIDDPRYQQLVAETQAPRPPTT